MDESEKKFEQWFRTIETGDDDKWELPAYRSPAWNAYLLRRQLALGAWLASRAAIEIKLPDFYDYTDQDTTRAAAEKSAYNSGLYDSQEAIRAAGIKVKE